MGKTAISAHNATTKHKNMARNIASNLSMKQFFQSRTTPANLDYKAAAAAEGAWAFHTAKHQQSFLSNDCTTNLIKAIFTDSDIAKKIYKSQNKDCKHYRWCICSISSQICCCRNLDSSPFQYPIMPPTITKWNFSLGYQVFSAKIGVRVRIPDLRSMPCETSRQIVSFICSSLGENGLRLENVTSFCADNAPVNFGGRQQTGKNNVFNRLQEKN